MRRIPLLLATLLVLAVLASCAKKSEEASTPAAAGDLMPSTPDAGASATPPATGAAWTMPADLDQGPRASSEPVDAALASTGAGLFKSKGCVTCHAFGKKVIGPDLAGVPKQRTARWMESQILHPEKMIVQDPVSKALFAQYKVPMTNQGLTPDQAKAVVEYLKQTDRGGK